jgi:hypothetical protein
MIKYNEGNKNDEMEKDIASMEKIVNTNKTFVAKPQGKGIFGKSRLRRG